jgi:NAD(P)-dependent dehydrogenase (short-subunit alcohol dehydrogenase family)
MNVLDMFRLNGQVALVTGAARGIGLQLATGLAEAGADVVLADIDEAAAMASADAVARGTGRRAVGLKVDVTRRESCDAMVQRTVDQLGRLDVCVANAGVVEPDLPISSIEDYPDLQWNRVVGVNLSGVFHTDMAAARVMKAAGRGRIVNIASIVGFVADAYWGTIGYTAAKGGVLQLTRQLACMLAPHGVRVNGIAPGYVATGMSEAENEDSADPEVRRLQQRVLDRTPMGRYAKPEELKGLAVFLASEASSYCTGHTYAADGGWLSA